MTRLCMPDIVSEKYSKQGAIGARVSGRVVAATPVSQSPLA